MDGSKRIEVVAYLMINAIQFFSLLLNSWSTGDAIDFEGGMKTETWHKAGWKYRLG